MRFGAQEAYLINVENICTNIFCKQFDAFKKQILNFIKQLLFEIDFFVTV